jgi:PKD repeat protein
LHQLADDPAQFPYVIPLVWQGDGSYPSPQYSARGGMYGVSGIPHCQWGGSQQVVGGGGSTYGSYVQKYNSISAENAPLEIDLTMDVVGGNFVLNADVTMTGDISTTNNKIVFIISRDLEGLMQPDYFASVATYGDQVFDLTTNGQTGTYTKEFAFNETWEIPKLRGIAIVQTFDGNHKIHNAAITQFSGLLPLFTTNINEGPACLGVQFTSHSLPVSGIQGWEWDFDGDGTYDSTEENPYYLYETPGTYDVTLRIFDGTEYAEVTQEDCIVVHDAGAAFSGELNGVWKPDYNPYMVDADVTISAGNSVVIEPGTEIHLNNGSKFTVLGELHAEGNWDTEIAPVTFVSDDSWVGFIFKNTDVTSVLKNCAISKATDSAISIETDAMVDIIGNKIYDNYSAANGAAITVEGSSNVVIKKNFITNNESQTLTGGISLIGSIPVIENNIIVNNTGNYAALSLKNGSDVALVNNVIAHNESAGGYHVFVFNSQISIMNSIIQEDGDIFFAPFGDPTIEYTCITGGFAGTGNIDADPMFENPTAGNGIAYNGMEAQWTLAADSPCIDAGNPDPMYNDLDGSRNDMGAFGGAGFINLTEAPQPTMPVVPGARVSVYPNPFNPSTAISLSIADADMTKPITVGIYNIKGQLVKTLADNEVPTQTTWQWNGTDDAGKTAASGLYFVKVTTASTSIAAKMVMMK